MNKWLLTSIIIVLVIATAILGLFLNQANNQLKDVAFDNTALEGNVSTLQSSLETANSRVNTLSNENTLLKTNLAVLRASLAALTASNMSLEEQLNSTTSKIATLTARIQTLNTQLTSLQNNQQPMYNQTLSLQEQLSEAFIQWTFYKNELAKSDAHIAWLEAGLRSYLSSIPNYYTPPDNSPVGIVTLTTAPIGANLIIDGNASGLSPLSITLSRGPHIVSANLTGYNSANQTINIVSGNNGSMLITWASSTN